MGSERAQRAPSYARPTMSATYAVRCVGTVVCCCSKLVENAATERRLPWQGLLRTRRKAVVQAGRSFSLGAGRCASETIQPARTVEHSLANLDVVSHSA
jgi:hypothetical protein